MVEQDLASTDAAIPSDFNIDNVLKKMMRLFKDPTAPLEIPESQLRKLCMAAREVILSQPVVPELSAPVNICGDIHGQFEDFIAQLKSIGIPPEQSYLFLGDYVDRGKRSLETICLMFAFKVKYPEHIFLLRGNHECASINRIYGFYDECKRRYNIKIWKTFTDVFNCLPLAAIVENTIFCMHGGLSPDLLDPRDLNKFDRPMDIPNKGVLCDLLWSDPDPDIVGFGDNDRGVSFTFGANEVSKFLKRNNLSLIVRAHQVVEDGYEFFCKRKMVTLFTAPNYCGEFDNAAAILSVSENLVCSFHIYKPNLVQVVPVGAKKK